MSRTINNENFGCFTLLCFFITDSQHPWTYVPLAICAVAFVVAALKERPKKEAPDGTSSN